MLNPECLIGIQLLKKCYELVIMQEIGFIGIRFGLKKKKKPCVRHKYGTHISTDCRQEILLFGSLGVSQRNILLAAELYRYALSE